jgi:hypothetical protein
MGGPRFQWFFEPGWVVAASQALIAKLSNQGRRSNNQLAGIAGNDIAFGVIRNRESKSLPKGSVCRIVSCLTDVRIPSAMVGISCLTGDAAPLVVYPRVQVLMT